MYHPLPATHSIAFVLGLFTGSCDKASKVHNSDSITGVAGQAGVQHG